MDYDRAIDLLENTFANEFDLNRFSSFINELFNHFNVSVRDVPFKNEYNDYIDKLQSLGVYKDKKNELLEVFVVKLKKSSSRDRARTMQRNLIATYLKKFSRNGALVAFYDDTEDWRFSFVKIEYSLIKDESGSLKVLEELTPATRYSFLVGRNEPNYTCKKRFLHLILEEKVDPEIKQIQNQFSIEKVTKKFFTEYENLYKALKKSLEKSIENDEVILEEFEDKIIKTSDFAKKLMGQIVFVYFLQKKGWLGVEKGEEWGTGSKKFLRNLFDGKIIKYTNFFDDVLEPFFYRALSVKWDDNYYPPFKCKIPFLNGGLFEPINDYDWEKTKIRLENDIFKEIFKIFDRYNFTVKEDEPLEKEVAVDPEMLGKVFENLLDVEERKNKGAFYTPREIVHFMCQESLINYLNANSDVSRDDIKNFIKFGDFASASIIKEQEQIKKYGRSYEKKILSESIRENHKELDELLTEIKIADPAVGSGAFPVGMMNEIIKARSILSLYSGEYISNYDLKLETIENSLYGVDKDSSAVDVTKLRFWLSLIVDENDPYEIDPLPNLDHKIMCGNSLIEEFEGKKLFDEKLLLKLPEDKSKEIKVIQDQIDELHRELGEIFTGKSEDADRKKQIKKEIKKLQNKKKNLQNHLEDSTNQYTLDQTVNQRARNSQSRLKELRRLIKIFFKEQDADRKKKLRNKIDTIEWELIEETLTEEGNEEAIEKLEEYKKNRSKPFFLWKLYFAEVFQRDNPGFDVVIANPPYIGEKGHKDIFRPIKISEIGKRFYKRKMDYFYFFFHKSLNISRNYGIVSFITTNYFITAEGALLLRSDFKNRTIVKKLINFNELKIFDSARGQHNMITILKKGRNDKSYAETTLTMREGNSTHEVLNSILLMDDERTYYSLVKQNKLYDGDKNYIRIPYSNSNEDQAVYDSILGKIKNNNELLGKIKNVNNGLLTSADKVTQKHINKYKINQERKGEGIFILSDSEINKLNLNNEELELIKPLYKNSDISKYYTNSISDKSNLIYATRDLDIDNYPNIKKHFLKNEKIIKGRSKNRGEIKAALKLGKWWVIFAARENLNLDGEKIVCPQRSSLNTFGYNNEQWYACSDVFFITNLLEDNINLKYILALLNSRLYYFWLYFRGKRKGELLELTYRPLTEIPIKEIEKIDQKPFIELIDNILELAKSKDYNNNKIKQSKVKTLEKQIDVLVYDLYEIHDEEREIVNKFFDDKFKLKNGD